MSVIPIDEVTRLTFVERPDGLVRLGIEHADEDLVGNVTWADPTGSWAYLTPADVDRLRAALDEPSTPSPHESDDTEALAYIRQQYSVPAWHGRCVVVDGQPGVIVGARLDVPHLRVRFDDGYVVNAHPTWQVEYVPTWQDEGSGS